MATYAMFATEGPSLSADGILATTDLSSPATAHQPQLETLSNQHQASSASVQDITPGALLELQKRIETLAVASPTPESITSSLAPSPTATATPLPDCIAGSGLYCIYTVKAGDTLSAIANRFGITASGELSPAEILALSNKPAVVETNSIETGLQLRIPTASGVIHSVFSNESLADIAAVYGVDVAAIQEANGIVSASVGQNILVPNPQYQRPAVAAAPPEPTATPEPEAPEPDVAFVEEEPEEPEPPAVDEPVEEPTAVPDVEPTPEPDTVVPPPPEPSATPVPATPTPRPAATATATPSASQPSRAGFIWPASGPISSYFGPSHPLGIDIDFFANPNQPVVAVADGVVTFAGGDPCCSYGYYVIVDHGNGFQTLYAHFSRLNVSTGTRVSQGTVLGLGGQTGLATGAHLHFEVHYNGAIVNPLSYLP